MNPHPLLSLKSSPEIIQSKDIIATEGCCLTVIIAASLELFVIVQAMRLDAVVFISSIHECHSESISFLCPQDRAWTNAGQKQWKVLRELW